MKRLNKAHTATANRIAKRYGARYWPFSDEIDIQTGTMAIEVETAATLQHGIKRLLQLADGPLYLAVTNKEAVDEALRATRNTPIGVMDPQGNILKQSGREPIGVEAGQFESGVPAMA